LGSYRRSGLQKLLEPLEQSEFKWLRRFNGGTNNALLEATDAHETVDEIVAVHDDEIEKSIAVGIGEVEAIAVQDNGTEASHCTTMEDISMDERAAIVEGTETCQGELTIEDGSVGNGTIDEDGAQARGAKGVSDVQGAQVVGGNGSMVSVSIVGARSQFGAAEGFGSGTVGAGPGATAEDAKPSNWGNMSKAQRRNWQKSRLHFKLKQAEK
jgi:hypothetical protein